MPFRGSHVPHPNQIAVTVIGPETIVPTSATRPALPPRNGRSVVGGFERHCVVDRAVEDPVAFDTQGEGVFPIDFPGEVGVREHSHLAGVLDDLGLALVAQTPARSSGASRRSGPRCRRLASGDRTVAETV